ncbi:MAG: trans-sulfuration enzyme family protein [Acidobacteriota bacterium]
MADKKKVSTLAVRAGEDGDWGANTGVPPIYQTSIFHFNSVAELREYAEGRGSNYLYTRYGNPTLSVVERKLAELEGCQSAMVFASGMGAMAAAILGLVQSGDNIVASQNLYGGTFGLLKRMLARFKVDVRFFPATNIAAADALIDPQTRLLIVESPTNPGLEIVDLAAAAALANRRGVVPLVDNTFASPINQSPAELGFRVIMHSATKFLGGHSDVTAGFLAGDGEMIESLRQTARWLGSTLDPSAAYLLMRGMKTLDVRVQRQNANAQKVAEFLDRHSRVEQALYPGLPSHPQHALARKQMRGFGGLVALKVKGGQAAAERFLDRLRLFPISVSLGGVDSIATTPLYTSHYGFSDEELKAAGISRNMVRLSIGIEDAADLIADLEQALSERRVTRRAIAAQESPVAGRQG